MAKKLDAELTKKLEALVHNHASVKQITQELNISRQTFYNWKKSVVNSDIIQKSDNETLDAHINLVEQALLKSCTGYTITEYEKIYNKDNELIETRAKDRHIKPSDRAIIFYLSNRLPKKWNLDVEDIAAPEPLHIIFDNIHQETIRDNQIKEASKNAQLILEENERIKQELEDKNAKIVELERRLKLRTF